MYHMYMCIAFEREGECTGAFDYLLCHFLHEYVPWTKTWMALSLSCVFSFCSKPSALRPAKMEEPAWLQICAVVRVGGLDGYVDKVLTD